MNTQNSNENVNAAAASVESTVTVKTVSIFPHSTEENVVLILLRLFPTLSELMMVALMLVSLLLCAWTELRLLLRQSIVVLSSVVILKDLTVMSS